MKKFAALSMAAVMLTSCFVGCGSKDDDTDVKGKWEACKVVESGQTVEGDMVSGFLQIEFKDGDVATVVALGENGQDATYKLDGDKLTLEEKGGDNEKMEFKVDGSTMTASMEGTEITLKKVDEFTTKASTADED